MLFKGALRSKCGVIFALCAQHTERNTNITSSHARTRTQDVTVLPFFSGVRVIACSLPYFGFPAILPDAPHMEHHLSEERREEL
jgi:hypothetical protein